MVGNQLFNVPMVNFNSTERSSVREVDFSRTSTTVAASFSYWNVILSKKRFMLLPKVTKIINFFIIFGSKITAFAVVVLKSK